MDEVNEQVSVRREKVAQLRAAGINPYPNDFKPLHVTQEIHDNHGSSSAEELEALEESFSVAGRVLALRKFGKASFLQVRDRAGAMLRLRRWPAARIACSPRREKSRAPKARKKIGLRPDERIRAFGLP